MSWWFVDSNSSHRNISKQRHSWKAVFLEIAHLLFSQCGFLWRNWIQIGARMESYTTVYLPPVPQTNLNLVSASGFIWVDRDRITSCTVINVLLACRSVLFGALFMSGLFDFEILFREESFWMNCWWQSSLRGFWCVVKQAAWLLTSWKQKFTSGGYHFHNRLRYTCNNNLLRLCMQSTQYKTVDRVVQTVKNLCCALDEVETQAITEAIKRLRHSVNLPRTRSPKVGSWHILYAHMLTLSYIVFFGIRMSL